MKNSTKLIPSDVHAMTAIQKIQKWVEENHPKLAAISKTRLIIECLIEVNEEKKFIAAQ